MPGPAARRILAGLTRQIPGGANGRSNISTREFSSTDATEDDPFDFRPRFVYSNKVLFKDALAEIRSGRKTGHWSWCFFPVAPYVVAGVEMGSEENQRWALRDAPPNNLRGDDAARALLRFQDPYVSLRDNYVLMIREVTSQVNKGISPYWLVGPLDVPKLESSLRLFQRASAGGFDDEVHEVCTNALLALKTKWATGKTAEWVSILYQAAEKAAFIAVVGTIFCGGLKVMKLLAENIVNPG